MHLREDAMLEITDEVEQWFARLESLSGDELIEIARRRRRDAPRVLRARRRVERALRQHGLDFDAWLARDRILTVCELATSPVGRTVDRAARQRLEWSAIAHLAHDVISEDDFDLLSSLVDRNLLGSDCRD